MQTRTRGDLAFERDVTPARISQIAHELSILPAFKDARGQVHYALRDSRRILKFDTKPGPKPKTNGVRK